MGCAALFLRAPCLVLGAFLKNNGSPTGTTNVLDVVLIHSCLFVHFLFLFLFGGGGRKKTHPFDSKRSHQKRALGVLVPPPHQPWARGPGFISTLPQDLSRTCPTGRSTLKSAPTPTRMEIHGFCSIWSCHIRGWSLWNPSELFPQFHDVMSRFELPLTFASFKKKKKILFFEIGP